MLPSVQFQSDGATDECMYEPRMVHKCIQFRLIYYYNQNSDQYLPLFCLSVVIHSTNSSLLSLSTFSMRPRINVLASSMEMHASFDSAMN